MENQEKKGKFVNFLHINKKKIGAIATSMALVICLGVGIKSCSDSHFDDENDITTENINKTNKGELEDGDFSDIIDQLDENNTEKSEENTESTEEHTYNHDNNQNINNGNNQGSNNQGGNNGGNNGGNTGGNTDPKPVDPTPVDPTPEDPKPQHTHSLVNKYEAHDENETCVVTRWQVCTDPNCPNAGTRLNQTVSRQAHSYISISEIEDPVGSGIWIVTEMCTVCNHTQERSARNSLRAYSMDVNTEEYAVKQKSLKL